MRGGGEGLEANLLTRACMRVCTWHTLHWDRALHSHCQGRVHPKAQAVTLPQISL